MTEKLPADKEAVVALAIHLAEQGDPSMVELLKREILESAIKGIQQNPSPEGPVYGIIDPDYARIYSIARCIAWSEGYALMMHGSFTRDLDLLAVPWEQRATEPEHLINRIVAALDDLNILVKDLKRESQATQKPHGRQTWTLTFKAFGDPRFIDVGVFSPKVPLPTPSGERLAQGMVTGEEPDALKEAVWQALVPFMYELQTQGCVTFMGLRNAIIAAIQPFLRS